MLLARRQRVFVAHGWQLEESGLRRVRFEGLRRTGCVRGIAMRHLMRLLTALPSDGSWARTIAEPLGASQCAAPRRCCCGHWRQRPDCGLISMASGMAASSIPLLSKPFGSQTSAGTCQKSSCFARSRWLALSSSSGRVGSPQCKAPDRAQLRGVLRRR